ncbi:MAG: TIGR02588 family protein [Xenococcaceae cyanobacterium]
MNDVASDRERQTSRSFAEWISFSISLFVLTLVVGLVVYQWVTKKDQPPILSVTIDPKIRQVEGQFYVPFTVANKGGEAVESVEIKAELDVNGEIEEIGSQQIDFLSEGETQSGAFIFKQNPSQGKPIVRVTGYKLP